MKNFVRTIAVLSGFASTTLLGQSAWIDESSVTYVGNGCEDGTVDFEVVDGEKLDVSFFANAAFAGGSTQFDQKGCSIKLDVYAPPGYRIAPSYVVLTGQAKVSNGGQATASAKLSRLGLPALAAGKTFSHGYNNSFSVASQSHGAPEFSECGGYLRLKIRTQITATRGPSFQSLAHVLMEDGATQAPYTLRCPFIIKPC